MQMSGAAVDLQMDIALLLERWQCMVNLMAQLAQVPCVLINRVQQHLDHQGVAINTGDTALEDQVLVAEPRRWLAMARSDLQTGQMKLVRAVAQPAGF